MIITDLNHVTRLSIKKCEVPNDLFEVKLEIDLGLKDGSKSVTQFFLTSKEMLAFETALSTNNVQYC